MILIHACGTQRYHNITTGEEDMLSIGMKYVVMVLLVVVLKCGCGKASAYHNFVVRRLGLGGGGSIVHPHQQYYMSFESTPTKTHVIDRQSNYFMKLILVCTTPLSRDT